MKLVHTLLLLVYYCIMCLTSGTQQNEEIKDEVNVQPHAMKGTSFNNYLLLVFCWFLTKIFTLLEEEEVMAGEDVTLLQEKIPGK